MKKTATVILLLCLMPTTAMAHKDNKAYILGGYLSCGQYVIAYEKDTYKDGERFTSDELWREVTWLKGFFSAYNLKVNNNKKNVLQGRTGPVFSCGITISVMRTRSTIPSRRQWSFCGHWGRDDCQFDCVKKMDRSEHFPHAPVD